MSWRVFDQRPYLIHRDFEPEHAAALRANELCFLRRQHRCEKVFGASKSCFVACPTDDSLEPLLALLEAKLATHGIETVVAVKERAYGQDIVCTKICGRIIESRFCVVILDETDKRGVSVANPNVYYEYGLMTALRKNVIPLQRDGMPLAFNIQSQDTIKYTPKNMAGELERAIRDAISDTEPGQQTKEPNAKVSARSILRRLELAGYVEAGRDHKASAATQDTQFITFISNKHGYLFLAKVDDEREAQLYLDDLQVLVYRINEMRKQAEAEIAARPYKIGSTKRKITMLKKKEQPFGTRIFELERELLSIENSTPALKRRFTNISRARLGFISLQDVDSTQLTHATEVAVTGTPIQHVWNTGNILRLDKVDINLSSPTPSCTVATVSNNE